MNLQQIKQAVDSGKTVYWSNNAYQVIKDSIGQYLVKCSLNDSCIGLHGQIGGKYEHVLNGAPDQFYMENRE